MAEALRVELPAGCDQAADLRVAEAALRRRQAGQLDVLVADPAEPAQDGQRLRVLRLVAVVEAQDDRLAARQRRRRRASTRRPGRASPPCQPARFSACICAANSRRLTYRPGNGAPAGGGAITWYMRIGTGCVPGRPAARVWRGRRGAGAVGRARGRRRACRRAAGGAAASRRAARAAEQHDRERDDGHARSARGPRAAPPAQRRAGVPHGVRVQRRRGPSARPAHD